MGAQPGRWREYEGGIEDWIIQRNRARALYDQETARSTGGTAPPTPAPRAEADTPAVGSKRKLSYKEQRELDSLPERIERLESEQRSISDALADGSLFVSDRPRATALSQRSAAIEEELMAALERWELLGSR